MANYNFDKDLLAGQTTEQILADLYTHHGYTVQFNNDNRYDLRASKDGHTHTVEVKHDIMAVKTGNVGVEYGCRGKDSGIATTQADMYAYRIGDNIYFIWTDNLKKMISDKKYFRAVVGGDEGSFTKMYLFKLNVFTANCKRVSL